MNIHISRIWEPTSDEWDQAWLTCPYSTYFHSREWAEIWSEYQSDKFSPAPIAFQLSNGTRVIFPLTRERIFRGMANRYISSPAGTFGGWLANRNLTDSEQLPVIDYICQKFPNIIWRFNPYETTPNLVTAKNLVIDETYTLDLSVGFEKIYKGFSKGHSKAAVKAQKAGVFAKLAETENDWDSYYQVYMDTHQRWGNKARSLYSWRFFKILYERKSSNIKLWLAYHEDKIIAGAINVHSPNKVIGWNNAALSPYFNLRPMNLLIYEMLKDAAEKGYCWFDLNPSGGLEGVINFKKSFGAIPKPSNVYLSTSVKQRFIGKCIGFYSRLNNFKGIKQNGQN